MPQPPQPERSPTWWDERYSTRESLWGAGPNRFVAEAYGDLAPWGSGRALDLSSGEGRNAIWLAERGWQVTGVDFSPVALGRARRLAQTRGVDVSWVEADLTVWDPPPGSFALVVVAYLHLSPSSLHAVWSRAAKALEPGGELFLIGHARRNLDEGVGGPQDPAVLWDPAEVADELRALGLDVTLCEDVRRPVEGSGEAIDARLRARRA